MFEKISVSNSYCTFNFYNTPWDIPKIIALGGITIQKKGVDISEMNGSVDFVALKNAGVEFVIIRCGFGSDYTNQADKRFEENVNKAQAANMPWGVYLYSYATNTSMAKSEAQHTLRLLNGRKPLYGVWYDVEDSSQAGSDLVSICQAYCGALEATGLYCGIYSMLSWLNGKLNSAQLDKYDKWVAQWSDSCDYRKNYGIWQYTDRLVIAGKTFDGNWAYKDYPAMVQAMSGAGKEEPEMTEAQIKEIAAKAIEEYFAKLAAKPTSDWAQEAVSFVQAEGLMNGDAEGGFRPQSPITREEVATVLQNAFQNS